MAFLLFMTLIIILVCLLGIKLFIRASIAGLILAVVAPTETGRLIFWALNNPLDVIWTATAVAGMMVLYRRAQLWLRFIYFKQKFGMPPLPVEIECPPQEIID